jgi:PPOX class probable F420-dependent enzyme
MTISHEHEPAGPAFSDPLATGLPAPGARQVVGQILDGPHVSVLSTANADGTAQLSVIFVKREGEDILFSTIEGRRKTANMMRDPRVTLLLHGIVGGAAGGAYATVYGTSELIEDTTGGAFHQAMYDLHMGGATTPPEPGARRVIVRVRPHRIYAPFPYSFEEIASSDEGTAAEAAAE